MKLDGSYIRGFTKIDLIVALVLLVFLVGFILLSPQTPREKSVRPFNCLGNLNGLHKGLASWGLDPSDPWRPPFPPTNMHAALSGMGISPLMFICPPAARDLNGGAIFLPVHSINRSIGISPATNTANLTASNCNYNYWTLRTEEDGDKVLVCDRNGLGNASNAVGAWGGNHDGKGGNYVKVSGEGRWAGTNDILALDGAMFNLSSNKPGWDYGGHGIHAFLILSSNKTGVGVVTNN